MLFTAIAAIIGYSLLNFGAVRPANYFFLTIIASAVAGGCLLAGFLRRERWLASDWLLMGSIIAAHSLNHSPLAVTILVACLCWHAARSSQPKTLKFLKVLAVFGLAEAILGLVQHFIAPGWIFGYLNTTFRVTGTLINRNHYAGLLEMFVPV